MISRSSLITTSIPALSLNIGNIKIRIDQFLEEFGESLYVGKSQRHPSELQKRSDALRVNKVGDDPNFLLSSFLDPGCHIELSREERKRERIRIYKHGRDKDEERHT
jgi:hypothetical protein